MKDEPTHQPILYVCLLSDFTIANAQAIYQFKPDHVIAISTPELKDEQKGVERRFKAFLKDIHCKHDIWGSRDNRDSEEPYAPPYGLFLASSAHKTKQWVYDYLSPVLSRKRHEGYRLVANITGGTKVASIALHNCFDWDDIHYTAEAARGLLETAGNIEPTALHPLPLVAEVRLLNDEVQELKDPWENTALDLLLKCGNILHDDYFNHEQSIMLKYDRMLRDLWYNIVAPASIKTKYGVIRQDKSWQLPASEIATFFKLFAGLHQDITCTNGGGIIVPADKGHDWVRFISGIWWEHLVAEWAGAHCSEVKMNIAINRNVSTNNEADILVRTHNNEMRVIECKVEPPGEKELKDIYNKLGSSLSRFGKTKAALMLSPAFFNRIRKGAVRANFLDACAFRDIKVLESQPELEVWLTDKRAR